MARALWRGTISFGMVTIPVKLFTATESQDVSFRQLHAADNSPISLSAGVPPTARISIPTRS